MKLRAHMLWLSGLLSSTACRGDPVEQQPTDDMCKTRLGDCDGDSVVSCQPNGNIVVDCSEECMVGGGYADGLCLRTEYDAICACSDGVACDDPEFQDCSADELVQCKLDQFVYTGCAEVCAASGYLGAVGCEEDPEVNGICICDGYGRIPCSTDGDCDSGCCAKQGDDMSGMRVCQTPDVCGQACAEADDRCAVNGDCCGFFDSTAFCTLFSEQDSEGRCAAVCADDTECDGGCCRETTSGSSVCHPSSSCGAMSIEPARQLYGR